jgi:acyl-CoA thioesterase II
MWVRFPGAPDDPVAGQELVAFATNFFLIGTAMRPHAGLSPGQSHLAMSTGVMSHTVTFHDRIVPGDWLAIEQESPFAGAGRTYGRGDVFDREGRLLASYVQDGMIRSFGDAASGHKGAGKTL